MIVTLIFRRKPVAVLLLFFIPLFFSGCKRVAEVVPATIVKGRITEYPSGDPVPGVTLVIWYTISKDPMTSSDEIGHPVTDQNGEYYFKFRGTLKHLKVPAKYVRYYIGTASFPPGYNFRYGMSREIKVGKKNVFDAQLY